MEHPEELERLRDDPALMPTAVDEIIRWATPVLHFRRTATRDVELRGRHDPRGRQGRRLVHLGQPRRAGLRRSVPLRRRPPPQRARELRARRPALLPRRAPRQARGQGDVRGAAPAARVDRARRPRRADPHQLHERVQVDARAGLGRMKGSARPGGNPHDGREPGSTDGDGVRTVRLSYPDLHGISRGKEYPVEHSSTTSPRTAARYCEAIMTVDLRHNVRPGFEHGFQDILARPDPHARARSRGSPTWRGASPTSCGWTATPVRVDSRGACCAGRSPSTSSSACIPVLGPGARVLPVRARPDRAEWGYRRYVDNPSHVYTVGARRRPARRAARACCTPAPTWASARYAANHEFGRSQFEINLAPRPRARRPPTARSASRRSVKEMAARDGLLATFIGKPWNDDEGSGFHLHISLGDDDGRNAAERRGRRGGPLGARPPLPGRHPRARPGADGVLQPDDERLPPHPRGGARADARQLGPRQPPDASRACRASAAARRGSSSGSATAPANPYLAVAAALFAGLDGIERELEPPAPMAGLIYEQPEAER